MSAVVRKWWRIAGCVVACIGLVVMDGKVLRADDAGVFQLGEVVVSERADTISQMTTVDTLDADDLDDLSAQSVAEALAAVPGITLSSGRRNELMFTLRGFSQRYVPVFYDGIPVYIPYDGYIDTNKLPIGNVSRISVSKGISSVLYGFNTMGGVVNIVSRRPQKPVEVDFDLSLREGPGWDGNINLGSRHGPFYFTVHGGFADTHAWLLSHDYDTDKRNQQRQRRTNSDSEHQTFSLKAGWMPAAGHEYAIGVQHIESEWGLPPEDDSTYAKFWRFTDWIKTLWYVVGDTPLGEHLSLQTRLYYDQYENLLDSYDDDSYSTQFGVMAFHSTYKDYSFGGSVVARLTAVPGQVLSASGHYKNDVHKEQDDRYADWERYEEDSYSFGIEDDIRLSDTLRMVVGCSYDLQKARDANGAELRDDEGSLNPQLGLVWQPADGTTVHASYGRKSRFPTLKEMYSGYFGRNLPNADLKEERAENYEVGIGQDLPLRTTVRLSGYYSVIKDLIVEKEVEFKVSQYQNIGRAVLRGGEIRVVSEIIPQHHVDLHYTFLDAVDKSRESRSRHLEDRSRHMLYISDRWTLTSRLSLFASVTWNSKRWYQDWYDYDQWKTLDNVWTVDAKICMQAYRGIDVEVGARNLLDADNEWQDGYPRPGRTLFTCLRGRFW